MTVHNIVINLICGEKECLRPLKSVRFNAARSVSLSRHMLELFLADNVLDEALGEVVAQLEDRVRT